MPKAKAKSNLGMGTEKTAIKNKKVTFKYKADGTANEVKVAGNFSNWDQGAIMMTKGKSGEWKAQVSLAPGEYEYKFLVDGVWHNDPGADRQVPNIWGSENSLRIVR